MNNIVKWFHEIDKPFRTYLFNHYYVDYLYYNTTIESTTLYFTIFNFSKLFQQLKVYVFNKQLFNYSKLKARSMLLSFNTRNLFDRKVQKLFGVKAVF